MAVLDTPEDWEWWLKCWDHVLDAAEITESDVAMMAFSFGPFIGFGQQMMHSSKEEHSSYPVEGCRVEAFADDRGSSMRHSLLHTDMLSTWYQLPIRWV